jgi:hypothetical protein
MLVTDDNILDQIDEGIKLKKWDILEKILNDTSLQFYHPDKIALIGLRLIEKIKKIDN